MNGNMHLLIENALINISFHVDMKSCIRLLVLFCRVFFIARNFFLTKVGYVTYIHQKQIAPYYRLFIQIINLFAYESISNIFCCYPESFSTCIATTTNFSRFKNRKKKKRIFLFLCVVYVFVGKWSQLHYCIYWSVSTWWTWLVPCSFLLYLKQNFDFVR